MRKLLVVLILIFIVTIKCYDNDYDKVDCYEDVIGYYAVEDSDIEFELLPGNLYFYNRFISTGIILILNKDTIILKNSRFYASDSILNGEMEFNGRVLRNKDLDLEFYKIY